MQQQVRGWPVALSVWLSGCAALPAHVAPPPGPAGAATLTVEMHEPPHDGQMNETMRWFSADLFEQDACKARARIVSMSQDRPRGRWVSRDESGPPGPRGPIDHSLEFRDSARFTTRIDAQQPVRLALYGRRVGQQYMGVATRTFTRQCHWVIEFKPEPGAAYTARLSWSALGCSAFVQAADPATPSEVPAAANAVAPPAAGAAAVAARPAPGRRVAQARVCQPPPGS